jgi:hypothetical protein
MRGRCREIWRRRPGKEYGDKETFLTSAYRQKLEERRKDGGGAETRRG